MSNKSRIEQKKKKKKLKSRAIDTLLCRNIHITVFPFFLLFFFLNQKDKKAKNRVRKKKLPMRLPLIVIFSITVLF